MIISKHLDNPIGSFSKKEKLPVDSIDFISGGKGELIFWTSHLSNEKSKDHETLVKAHNDWINSIISFPRHLGSDTAKIATCSDDSTIRFWNLSKDSKKCTATKSFSKKPVNFLFFLSGKRLLAASEKTIKTYDLEKEDFLTSSFCHSTRINSCIKLKDSSVIVSCSHTNIYFWDLRAEKVIKKVKTGNNYCLRDITQETFAVGCDVNSQNCLCRIWDVRKFAEIEQLTDDSSSWINRKTNDVLVMNEKSIICGCSNNNICNFKIYQEKFTINKTYAGHFREITCLHKITNDYFVSASNDCTLKVWDNDKCIKTFKEGHFTGVKSLCTFRQVDTKGKMDELKRLRQEEVTKESRESLK